MMDFEAFKTKSLIFNMSTQGYCFFDVRSLPELNHIANFLWSIDVIREVERAFFEEDRATLVSGIPIRLSVSIESRNREIGYLVGTLFNPITKADRIIDWYGLIAYDTAIFIVRNLPCPDNVLLRLMKGGLFVGLPKEVAKRPFLSEKVVLSILEENDKGTIYELTKNLHLGDELKTMVGLKAIS